MADLKVFYKYKDTLLTGDCTLTIQQDSIAYTIAEYESRNTDQIITHYMNSENEFIDVPASTKPFQGFKKGEHGMMIVAHVGLGKTTLAHDIAVKMAEEKIKVLVVGGKDTAQLISEFERDNMVDLKLSDPRGFGKSSLQASIENIHMVKAQPELYIPREKKHREKNNWKRKTRKGR